LFGEGTFNEGSSTPGLIGGMVRLSNHFLISEWPSAKAKPAAPLW